MDIILYLATGLVPGVLIGYFICVSRPSKKEIATHYVGKDLHDALVQERNRLQQRLQEEQEALLLLTRTAAGKLSRAEVEKDYIPRESYTLIHTKLSAAEAAAQQKEQSLLDLHNKLTALQQKESYLQEKLDTFTTEMQRLHHLSQEQFRNLATVVLEEKKQLFVHENKKELHTILDPLKTDLNQFREKVEATRREDIQDITSLKKEIEGLHKLNTQLSDDARNLASALKSEVKMQGNWGEDRLNMILETEGLQQYIDYSREEMYRDEEQERNRKPDFILRLPDGKHIIIDSKVSLTAYVNYFNAATPEEKAHHLRQHIRSVTDHMEQLADKNYQNLAGLTTPDYVFMFMPVEPALTLAMNQHPELFNNALKRKIVLIAPTTLVATLKIVKVLWQKEKRVQNVEEIFRQCGELYNKFVGFLDEMDKVGDALNMASGAHRAAMNSLKDGTRKGNTIIGRFEAIKKLEARTSKQIPDKHLASLELLRDEAAIILPPPEGDHEV